MKYIYNFICICLLLYFTRWSTVANGVLVESSSKPLGNIAIRLYIVCNQFDTANSSWRQSCIHASVSHRDVWTHLSSFFPDLFYVEIRLQTLSLNEGSGFKI